MDNDLKKFFDSQQKRYGKDAVYVAGDAPPMDVISTGSVSLDFATGVMGIPRGRVVEIYGPESIGKTSLLYYMMAEEQKRGRPTLLVNLEGSFDPAWAARIAGLDISTDAEAPVMVANMDNGLQAVEMVGSAVHSGSFGLVALDSIGAMLGEKESEPGAAKQAYGQSGLVTHLVKLVTAPAARNLTTCIFLNQLRDATATRPGLVATKAPGGRAVKHQAAVRIELKRTPNNYKTKINGDDIEVGFQVAAKIKKNKAAAPNGVAYWNFYNRPLLFDGGKVTLDPDGVVGIDKQQEIIDLALNHDVIRRLGAYYLHETFPLDDKEQHRLFGKESVFGFLRDPENDAAREQIRMELMRLSTNHVSDKDKLEVANDAGLE